MKNKTYEKKNFVPKTLVEEVDDEDDEEVVGSEFEDLTDSDSDEESLQRAFRKGDLSKDGLNIMLPFKKKFLVNNETGLTAKLEEMKGSVKVPWIERLDLVNVPIESADLAEKYGDLSLMMSADAVVSGAEREDQVQHDFKREMLFYRQAQSAILDGIPKLKALGLKTRRPDDYFAQMVKTDDHMKKVQEKLNERKEQMERSEKAKKMRLLKKMGKQVQVQVLQDRQKEKRDMMESVKEFQAGKTDTIDLGDGQVISRSDVTAVQKDSKKKKKIPISKDKKKRIVQKRKHKNQTFGYGGKKKGNKMNNQSSFNGPMFGMRSKGRKPAKSSMKARNGKAGGGGKGGGGGKNRPGKSRRQNAKGKK